MAVPEKKLKITNIYDAEDVFQELDDIPTGVNGISVRADFDALEGQNLSVRRIVVDGDDYIEINGKLTYEQWEQTRGWLKNIGKTGDLVYESGTAIDDIMVFSSKQPAVWTGKCVKLKVGNTILEVADDSQRAQQGLFRIRTRANGGVKLADVERILHDADIDFISYNPSQEAETLMKKVRLLWQRNPGKAHKFSTLKNKLAQIDDYLDEAGIKPSDASKLILEEVFDGYSTYMDYDALSAYQKAGLEYVWSGVRTKESVVAMIKSGGMQSSKRRIANGFMGNGSSISSDIRTGGADSVFTRIATTGANKSGEVYDYSYCSGDYQIIMNPKVMARTDWYAYSYDNFGNVSDIPRNGSALDFVKGMNKSWESDNEIMFRNGIRLQDWAGIDTDSQWKKDSLIAALQSEGITEINGIPLDKFIRVNNKVGKAIK